MKPSHYFLALNLVCGLALAAAWLLSPTAPATPSTPTWQTPVTAQRAPDPPWPSPDQPDLPVAVLKAQFPIPLDTVLGRPETYLFPHVLRAGLVPPDAIRDLDAVRDRAIVRPIQAG